jgi:hypothetical protein
MKFNLSIIKTFVLLLLMFTSFSVFAQSTFKLADDMSSDQYDFSFTLKQLNQTPKNLSVKIEQKDSNNYLELSITALDLSLTKVSNNKKLSIVKIPVANGWMNTVEVLIARRDTWIGIQLNNNLIWNGTVNRTGGDESMTPKNTNWEITEVKMQRTEPVIFNDDFMRTSDEDTGKWTNNSGNWGLTSPYDKVPHGKLPKFNYAIYSQNPFSISGSTNDTAQPAIYLTGDNLWDSYHFTVSMQPTSDGGAGILLNVNDKNKGYAVIWYPVVAKDNKDANSLVLYKWINNKFTEISRTTGGFIPKQWYNMSAISRPGKITISIDGKERATIDNPIPWKGGIGLLSSSKTGVTYDDVTITSFKADLDALAESKAEKIGKRFQVDNNGMKEWALTSSDWITSTIDANLKWYNWNIYGDKYWMVMNGNLLKNLSGSISFLISTDGTDINSGYSGDIKFDAAAKPVFSIKRLGKVVATIENEIESRDDLYIRLRKNGNIISFELDDKVILTYKDDKTLTGSKAGYIINGYLGTMSNIMVVSKNLYDYTFSDAPTDWYSDGTWMPTIRWSCSPNWSFLSGWSRGDAALWHKQKFTGDHDFQAFVGVKMEYPREHDYYELRYRDFAISICSDGVSPRTGYSGVYGFLDKDGIKKTVLMKNGEVVASNDAVPRGKDANHRNWFDLQLRKKGDTVEFWVEGQKQLEYKDPKPIEGGIPSIWTNDNGISLARSRIWFVNNPVTVTDNRVVLDEPWYPEWGNAGQSTSLDFTSSYSSSGKPIKYEFKKILAPEGQEAATLSKDGINSLIPRESGDYWYTLMGSDGTINSAPFHLNYKVFNPVLGRDDSHALCLYKFNESDGRTIKDTSKNGDVADLTIYSNTGEGKDDFWWPVQGLMVHGNTPIMTKSPVKKLSKIKETKAFTVEAWISTDTIYPPSGWAGVILSCEKIGGEKNFTLGHYYSGAPGNILMVTTSSPYLKEDPRNLPGAGFRTGLQHIVVTWDGKTTKQYINNKLVVEREIVWDLSKWIDDPVLILGNNAAFNLGYRGSYYLIAIHDKSLALDEINRNYNAGPSAR